MEKNGYHIPPYRLMKISEHAAKIVKQIVCEPAVNFIRQEADIILDIVRDTLDKRTEGDESSPWS